MGARAAFYKEMYYLGVLSINEIRALEDMNSIGEDGDARFVQSNMMPLDRALQPPEPIAPPSRQTKKPITAEEIPETEDEIEDRRIKSVPAGHTLEFYR
jgi:hypothetical protein